MPTAPHHLLVVDDEPFIGRMIEMQFGQGPFSVSIALDGPAGLALLRANPDAALALVDVNLPGGLSGLDVIEEAHRDPACARVPFVVLTATGQQAHIDRARALGASAIVTKPFSPHKLYLQVCSLVGEPTSAEA